MSSKPFRTSSILCAIVCLILAAFAASAPAQSSPSLDKHARKVYHKLARYSAGQYLHLVLSNSTSAYGALGTLSATNFTFTNADSNTVATYAYANIDRIKTDRESIGQGSEPRHIKHLVPIAITAAAVAAGAITYESVK